MTVVGGDGVVLEGVEDAVTLGADVVVGAADPEPVGVAVQPAAPIAATSTTVATLRDRIFTRHFLHVARLTA